MNVEDILEEIAEEPGWNTESKLALCLEYIANQQDDGAFEDFLRRRAEEEKAECAGEDD